MSKIPLSEIAALNDRIDTLRVVSFECDVYLVEVDVDGKTLLVVGDDGAPISWRSQLAAKKPFKGLGVTHATLKHHSSYDEMIGLGESADAMEIRIQLPDADYS